jgi:hypothetical protein
MTVTVWTLEHPGGHGGCWNMVTVMSRGGNPALRSQVMDESSSTVVLIP